MPDLTIEAVEVCPQWTALYAVAGTGRDSYRVHFEHGDNHCSCPAFRFFKGPDYDRTCKHIQLIETHGCLYHPQRDTGPNDLVAQGVSVLHHQGSGSPCPGCGEPTVVVRIAV